MIARRYAVEGVSPSAPALIKFYELFWTRRAAEKRARDRRARSAYLYRVVDLQAETKGAGW